MFNPLSITFLSFYVGVSFANLVFCFLENERWRKITKPFCMLFLLGFVFSTSTSQYWIIWASVFPWIGDVLFLFKKQKIYVAIGTVSFLISHIFYVLEIVSLLQNTGDPNAYQVWCQAMFFSPLLLLPGLPLCHYLSKRDWKLTILGSCYQAVLLCLFSSTVLALCFGYSIFLVMVLFGAALYYVSDMFNAYTLYRKKIKKRELIIMSTYLTAQALLVLGMLLTLA